MTQTNTSANLAAAEESTTDKTAPASCPLNAPYLQLIPVRYAYVENLAYKKTDTSKKQIHPTGIRLLRDGWLYVVDTHINRIYEHTLKDGLITARTFKGKLVTDQTRESYDDIEQDKGDEKRLLFKKGHKVYVSYSQVQWSDEKCNQMLKSKERKTFMQEIDLANVSCENITNHLMTREQAEKHIAEVAEEYKAPEHEVEFDEEKTAYSWTCTEFTPSPIGKLTQTLSKEYEQKGNYLFVIVEDYLGMMLDLVQEQRLVSKWLGDWSEKNNNSLKYNVGSYIESTLTVTPGNATQKGASLWIESLPAEQQQTIYDYINEKIAFDKASEYYWMLDPNQTSTEYVDTIRTPQYYEHQKEVEAKRQRIISEQGTSTYEEHREEIESIIQNQKEHLDGKGLGGRGINRLAETHKVQEYLKKERPKYNRWQERLDLITDARCDLYMDYFHMATWYYSAKQKQELLELEEEIMSDLFRNEESIERFSQFLEEKPYYHYPAIQSNFDYKYIAETLPTIVKWFTDTSNYVQATTNQTATPIQRLEELMGRNYWAQLFAETGRTQELQQVRALNLSAAVNRSLDTFMRTLTGPILNEGGLQRFNTAVERYTNLAQTLSLNARAAFLFEIRQMGFVYLADNPLNMANTQKAINTLNNNLTSIRANRQTLDRLQRDRANLQNSMSDESRGLSATRRTQEINRINREITTLERDNTSREATISRTQTRLAELISPLREGEGNASIRFTVSAERQAAIDFERNALTAGARAAYGQGRAGFASAANSTRVPMFLFVFSVYNLNNAMDTFNKDKLYAVQERLPLINSISSTVSAFFSVWQTAHIALLERVVERIAVQQASLAGANLLSRIGRLNILLGGAGQIFSGISSYISLYTNFSKWYSAILKGDTGLAISAATAMTATAGNAAIGTYGLYQTVLTGASVFRDIRAGQLAARTVWAVRGAQFATALGRVTPVGIVLTVLQVAGEFAFNYYNTSELQDWFQYCCWGRSNKGWDQIQHNQQLAEALLKPMVIDQGVVPIKGKNYRRLRVLCVGQIQNGVESQPIQWQASWVYANKDDDAGALLKQCTRPADQVYPYVAFDWYLPWQEKNEWKRYVHGNVLNIRLFYTPDLATKPLGGEQGVGYLVSLRTWDNDSKQQIRQVAGNKVTIPQHSSLVAYQGEIYE